MKAEKALLGTMIKENHLIKDSTLKTDHFSDGRHKNLFTQMKNLANKNQSVDMVTLSISGVDRYGGVSYLNEMASLADEKKFEEYEQIILDGWKEREKRNILSRAADWEIGKVISALDDINEVKTDDHTSISDALVDMYEAPWQEQTKVKGVPTGLNKLQRMTDGFQDGEVTVIAARPSMGKSDIMLHFAKQAGWQGYLPILFSLEMPERSLTNRIIASTGKINRSKMRNLKEGLSEQQKKFWPSIIGKVSETNIQIFDGAGQSVSEMRAKTRKLMHKIKKKPIVIIDYLTLIKPENFYGGNTHSQVTEISKNIKNLAKELNIHVIVLAQLSRAVEQRQDKRPIMSDIRESGSVEQDADVIMFLYREKYYNKESNDDSLELIIAKNRNGPVGIVKTRYNEFTGEIIDDY